MSHENTNCKEVEDYFSKKFRPINPLFHVGRSYAADPKCHPSETLYDAWLEHGVFFLYASFHVPCITDPFKMKPAEPTATGSMPSLTSTPFFLHPHADPDFLEWPLPLISPVVVCGCSVDRSRCYQGVCSSYPCRSLGLSNMSNSSIDCHTAFHGSPQFAVPHFRERSCLNHSIITSGLSMRS